MASCQITSNCLHSPQAFGAKLAETRPKWRNKKKLNNENGKWNNIALWVRVTLDRWNAFHYILHWCRELLNDYSVESFECQCVSQEKIFRYLILNIAKQWYTYNGCAQSCRIVTVKGFNSFKLYIKFNFAEKQIVWIKTFTNSATCLRWIHARKYAFKIAHIVSSLSQ